MNRMTLGDMTYCLKILVVFRYQGILDGQSLFSEDRVYIIDVAGLV